ncbi:hypothetical protein Ssi03_45230 [Sphaerisporangium siamense]|uniref:DNA-directed RNA polymerase specialized sigma24 family protein n=1 Tax=Sphaerisporangium siamense TaxID=795645 RepID=A0A7W7DEB8_9ACTN|nr:DNA-directed RNA polymerase specialized sigma24 family protein [Sphaerisporangium siamense]GII86533.1 hypothetical protein Ssi03_45230 [Sphaerisporangium siamense]
MVQKTFLLAWKNVRGFEGRSTFRAWSYRRAEHLLKVHPQFRPVARDKHRERVLLPRPRGGHHHALSTTFLPLITITDRR